MSKVRITPKGPFVGEIDLPGDKSITHRALILSGLCNGTTVIDRPLLSEDCLATVDILKSFGVKVSIARNRRSIVVKSKGVDKWKRPKRVLQAANSGTTMRLFAGIASGLPFDVVIDGDSSLRKRPMLRIAKPLNEMGAVLSGRKRKGSVELYPPLRIQGGRLRAIKYKSEIASAQVKSAVLLAGLFCDGKTIYEEPAASRDHTERMFEIFGLNIQKKGNRMVLEGPQRPISPGEFFVPADISSAAFFMALAAINDGSSLLLRGVGLNPTRTAIIKIMREMGVYIKVRYSSKEGEPFGDISVKSSALNGVRISKEMVPKCIDEIPIISVLACFADSPTYIEAVQELKVKESDRIKAIVDNLSKMGGKVSTVKHGSRIDLVIRPSKLRGAHIKTYGDHRIAMAMAIAAVNADGPSIIDRSESVAVSFPGFWECLNRLNMA